MNRLLRLYPRPWWERYEAEVDELLAERPASLRDRFDLVRGATDAWLHPQVAAPASTAADGAGGAERLVVAGSSILGGLLLAAAGLSMNATPLNATVGYKETGVAGALLIVGLIVTGISAVLGARGRRTVIPATTMLLGGLLTLAGWPILIVGFLAYAIACVILGLIRLAASGPVEILFMAIGITLPSFNTEDERALLLVPVGLAWALAGVVVGRRLPALTRSASTAR